MKENIQNTSFDILKKRIDKLVMQLPKITEFLPVLSFDNKNKQQK